MNTALASFLSWLALPVYAVIGSHVRANAMRLGPPTGPIAGQFGKGDPSTRILVIGDSSAAGVGLDTTEKLFGRQLAQKMHSKTDAPVSWRVSGHNSATAGSIRDYVVPHLSPENYTHIFVMLGINDMKNFHTAQRWGKEFGTLLYALRTRFPEAQIYWPQAMDLSVAPAIPKSVSTVMNWRRLILNRVAVHLCIERGATAVPPLPDATADGFCMDGFHANADGFDAWTDHFLKHIKI